MRRKKLFRSMLGMLSVAAMAIQPMSAMNVAAAGTDYDSTIIKDRYGNPIDLGGIEIVIRDWWTDPAHTYLTDPADDYEKARKELVEWCEATYNFTVRFEGNEGQATAPDPSDGWSYVSQEYLNYVNNYNATAQKDEYYVFTLYDDQSVSTAVAQGKMYDLATLDYIDFSNPIFQANKVHEQYSIKNHIYAMYTGICEPRTGVYFNKDVLTAAGIDPDSIYEAQKNGIWTWDMFNTLIAKVTDIDEDNRLSSDNVFGLVTDQSSMTTALVISNGGQFVSLENEMFVNRLSDPKTVAAIKYADTLSAPGGSTFTVDDYVDRAMAADGVFDEPDHLPDDVVAAGQGAIDEWMGNYFDGRRCQWEEDHQEFMDSTWEYYKEAFAYGNIAFLFGDQWMGTSPYCNDMGWSDLNIGFVMCPAGPSGQLMNLLRNNAQVIPGCYDKEKAQKIAFAYYVMNQDPKGWEGYNQFISTSQQGIFDERAIAETIPAMCHPNYGMVTYDCMVPNLEIGPQFLWEFNGQDDPYNPDAIGLDNYIAQVSAQWDKYVYDANNGITAGVKGSPNYIRDLNLSWNDVAGKKFWYEDGYKQGTVDDPKSFEFEGTIRGREIADPATNEWYWLDADAEGAAAETKEVFMPYIYQDEKDYLDNDAQIRAVAQLSNTLDNGVDDEFEVDLSEQVYNAIVNNGDLAQGGKWVRYTAEGEMIKGWFTVTADNVSAETYATQAGNTYFYDPQTGLMAKGFVTINGVEYHFDEITGVKLDA